MTHRSVRALLRSPLGLAARGLACTLLLTHCNDPGTGDAGPMVRRDAAARDAARPPGGDAEPARDGGGTDAAAPTDAGARADAASPACTAILCEDFESGEIDETVWTVEAGYQPTNRVEVQGARVAHGAYAMHAHIDNTVQGFAHIRETMTFPALATDLWGRLYLYNDLGNVSHTAFISAFQNTTDNLRLFELGQYDEGWQITYFPSSGEQPRGGADIPRATFTCIEWHFSTTSPYIELFVDGAATYTFEASGPADADMVAIAIGIQDHGSQTPAMDVYIDDIAIDDARVGCLP